MTRDPILLDETRGDLTLSLSPEKVRAIHDRLDRIIALLSALVRAEFEAPSKPREPDGHAAGGGLIRR